MFIVSNEKLMIIIQSAIILSAVSNLANGFDQCDVRGKFTNAKGKVIFLYRYNFIEGIIDDTILLYYPLSNISTKTLFYQITPIKF